MQVKHIKVFLILTLLYLLTVQFFLFASQNQVLKIGILSYEDKDATLKKWRPLADYLNTSLEGLSFEVVPLFYDEMDRAVSNKALDFVLTNPGHFIELKTTYNLSGSIATLLEKDGETSQTHFGGVIFTKSTNTSINSIRELKGKSISAVSKSSLGGYQAQAYELLKEGLDLDTDFDFVFTGMPHTYAVEKVINGEVDAGFVRSGTLEKMALEGEIDLAEIRVIDNRTYPNFGYLISTNLYPEWPFAAASHVDIDTSRAVASMLLSIKPGDAPAQEIGIYGFNIPSNYLGVEEVMRALKLKPFDNIEPFSFSQIWKKYRFIILGVAFIVTFLFIGLVSKWISEKNIKVVNSKLNIALEELTTNNARFEALFNNMHDGFALHELIYDNQGNAIDYKFLDANHAFEDLTGLRRYNIIGKTVLEILPKTERIWIDTYANVVKTGIPYSFSNYSSELDKYFHVNVYAPSPDHFATVISDITLDVHARQLMERENEELLEAKEKAEASNTAKSHFLANMSHEIRTPMNGMIGALQLLELTPLSHEQMDLVNMSRKSSDSLLKLVNDILDYAKIEANVLAIDNHVFNLHDLVADIESLFLPATKEKQLRFVTSISDDLPTVLHGDGFRVKQILNNLVGNAYKFTSDGEIRVTVNKSSANNNTLNVAFNVTDTGVGIPDHATERIFDRFTQLDASMTRQFGGSGLGLSICKGLVEQMNGSMHVKSTYGQGSTFTFILPFSLNNDPIAEVKRALPIKDLGAKRAIHLLVAEDDEVSGLLLKKLASTKGWTVTICKDGQQAVNKFTENEYDLILMDVQMPVLDGLLASKQIRTIERSRVGHTPIVALTANAFESDRQKCLDAEMDAFLTKPLNFTEFYQVIESMLQ